MNKDFVSASEIAEYLYCERSWWYRLRGTQPPESATMILEEGTQAHKAFAKDVQIVTAQSRFASRLFWAGIALLLVLFLLKLVSG